jgi:hypothetical protein
MGLNPRFNAAWADSARLPGHGVVADVVGELIDHLFEIKEVGLALAWGLLVADPKDPRTVQRVLPNGTFQVGTIRDALQKCDLVNIQLILLLRYRDFLAFFPNTRNLFPSLFHG